MGGNFGIRWDLRSWSTRLAIVTFALSIGVMGAHHLPAVAGGAIIKAFILVPADVRHGLVWQLLTYGFVEASPFGMLFAVYCLLVFGGDVESRLGSRNFLAWFFGLSLASGLVTVGLSLFWRTIDQVGAFAGADPVGLGLLVVWVALNRGAMVSFFFVLPMRAEILLYLSIGILVLYSISGSPASYAPDYAAFAVASLATRSRIDLSPRRAYLRFRARQIERQLRKRARHFTVISGGTDDDDPDDKGPGKNGYLN